MRELKDFSVLILPGLGGAGEDHWQTHWERAFPEFVRVQQADWENVAYDDWAPRLTEAVMKAPRPVVLVAHSLGTSLTMKWSFDQPAAAGKVAGAFLVAPSDRDRFRVQNRPEPRGFGQMLLKRLPFPSMVVAIFAVSAAWDTLDARIAWLLLPGPILGLIGLAPLMRKG